MKILIAVLMLVMSLQSVADDIAWIRVVDGDGQVFDSQGFAIDRVTDCGTQPTLRDDQNGYGVGYVRFDWLYDSWSFVYEARFYNSGAVTGNPNTTGDQVVYIQKRGGIFYDGQERCIFY